MLAFLAPDAYDAEAEQQYRSDVEKRLKRTWQKNANVIVPYGYQLGFSGEDGSEVAFKYETGTLKVTIDGTTVVSFATDAALLALQSAYQAADTALQANITSEASTRASADTAIASSVTTLTATVAGNTASISTNATAIATVDGKLTASYGIAVDANGRIASLKLLSNGTTSSIEFIATTFKVYNGTTTETPFEISGGVVKIKTANVGVLTAANISVSNLSAISADLGTVTAGRLNLTSGSYVVRHGAGFGASSDLVLWYGLSSVADGSATKTNGVFALATDGKIYAGNAELSNPVRVTIGSAINVIGSSGFTGTITVTATGGNGSYTYQWVKEPYESGIAASLTNSTTATVTVSASLATGEDSTGRVRCYVYDGNGVTASISQAYNFSKTS